MATVLVGTDGSPNAAAALRWALEYARNTQSDLRVMHVWHYPYAASEAGAMMAPTQLVFEENARAALDEALTGLDTSGVVVEKRIRAGSPSAVLLEESKNADTLVVGARGHGGFAGLVLGSTATHCARHAQIPTVVIPRRSGAHD